MAAESGCHHIGLPAAAGELCHGRALNMPQLVRGKCQYVRGGMQRRASMSVTDEIKREVVVWREFFALSAEKKP